MLPDGSLFMYHKDYFPREENFVIWDDGDSSVGIPGNESDATIYIQDKEHLESVSEVLVECFTKIHDMKVNVLTEKEFQTW